MTVINHKSISGITSITAAAGSDDLLTVHTNDTTERFRIVDSGAIVTGVTTASNFKTGTTNVHNVGVEAAGINVLGADTPIGTGATIYDAGGAVFTGVVTATEYRGGGSTGIKVTSAGRVGIGSEIPSSTLDVAGGAQFKTNGGAVKIESSPGTNFTQVQLVNTGGSFYIGRENSAGNWFSSGTGYASVLRSDGAYPLIFRVNNGNRVSIKSDGKIGINTVSPARMLHIFSGNTGHPVVLERGDSANTQIELRTGGAVRGYWGSSNAANFMVYDNDASQVNFVVNQTGEAGLGIVTPTAGDLASGASFAAPKFHILGDNNQSGAYELLARFGSGTDADDSGATIVLNHANDRGLAIQGGRSVGNRSYGALKSIDNVGRISDAIEIRGANGQGVQHLAFYTGDSTTTTQRLHITSGGHILTQSLTGTSFNNDSSNAKVYEFTGDGTVGEYGVINISANQNANNSNVGTLRWINRENANSSSGNNAASKQVAAINAFLKTSDTNAGDDSGGYLCFYTKDEGEVNQERVRINNDGKVLIGYNSSPDSKLQITNGTLKIETHTTFYSGSGENGENYPTIFLNADHSSGNNPAHGKITVRHSNQNTYSGDILLMPQGYYSGSYGYQEVVRVSAHKRVGINKSNPDSTLHVYQADGAKMTLECDDNNDAWINYSGASNEMSGGFDKSVGKFILSNSDNIQNNQRITVATNGSTTINGASSTQLTLSGTEADLWLNSTGSSLTTWRILGSTGGVTHRFRIYDNTNGTEPFYIKGQAAGQKTKGDNNATYINHGLMINKHRSRSGNNDVNSVGAGPSTPIYTSQADGECVFSIDPSWSIVDLRTFFNNDNIAWVHDENAPGGYCIQITGGVWVGGDYGSSFPYIPIDDDDKFYMEVYMRAVNSGDSNGTYMGSIEYDKNFLNGTGNPGSYGYWVMSGTSVNSTSWTRYTGTLGPNHSGSTGDYKSGHTGGKRKYWTPQALFNYGHNSGTRTCYMSGWRVIRTRHRSNHYFQSLSKGSGSFQIDHPLPAKKDTHYLQHSFIEGPKADLIYRGKTTLVAGISTVNIDTEANMTAGTFVALNTDVQCHTTNETGWTATKGSVSGNQLTITAQNNTCTDTISWMVIGERQDEHIKDSNTTWTDDDGKVIVEYPKTPVGLSTTPMTAPAINI